MNALKLELIKRLGVYFPRLEKSMCNNCGLCYRVCPAIGLLFNSKKNEALSIFHKLIGNFIQCYVGYATDPVIRFNSSSGGLVTQLLLYALENKIVDGAVVVKMCESNPLRPEPFIARTKEELIKAMGSKYCPVPIGLSLREILETERERFAVVGLPCHIRAIKNAQTIVPKLQRKIVLYLGLFCNHVPSFLATELFLRKIGISKEDVIELKYRGEGWPGFMKISLRDGRKVKVALPLYWQFIGSSFFYPPACLLCGDALNEAADISFGDAWLTEFRSDSLGTSLIVVRTLKGARLIEEATQAGRIKVESISPIKVIESQLGTIYFKKKVRTRANLFGYKSTETKDEIMKTSVFDILYSLLICLSSQMLSKSWLLDNLIVNEGFFRIYNKLHGLLFSKVLKDFSRACRRKMVSI